MPPAPSILARGPWHPGGVEVRWSDEPYEPPPERARAADEAIAALRDRGSPSHDGVAARLVSHHVQDDRLVLELQPMRWALRLVDGHASESLSAICVVRSHDGRWLAGRRAGWVSTWPNRWALGAAGAVDPFESPLDTLVRELREEWSVAPARVRGEALVMLEHRMAMFVGQARVEDDCEVVPDHEHDAWAWWPSSVDEWPAEADERLRLFARTLEAGGEH